MTVGATDLSSRPQDRFVLLPNRLLHHYVDLGVGGDMPSLVFLHGYTDSWRSFEPLFAGLGRDFRLLALDQRGHGDSEAARHYAIADFADDAIDFIEAVARTPVHLVGHSLGSIIAQRVAQRRPDLVRSLVLIGAARHAAGHADLAALRQELAAFTSAITRDFVEAFQRGTTHVELSSAQLDIFVAESLKLHPDTWRKTLDGLIEEPEDERQGAIDTPALVVWGAQDTVFGEEAQAALARDIGTLTPIHYPAVGHAPHWEIPDRVARDILSFVLAREGRRHED